MFNVSTRLDEMMFAALIQDALIESAIAAAGERGRSYLLPSDYLKVSSSDVACRLFDYTDEIEGDKVRFYRWVKQLAADRATMIERGKCDF